MAFLHCEMVYGVAIIRESHSTVQIPRENVDFVTGDVSGSVRNHYYNFGTVNGVTLSLDALSTEDTVFLSSATAYSIGDKVSIQLNSGPRFVTFIDDKPGGNEVKLVDPLPGDADTGNNFVSMAQLDGTTDGTLDDDFKVAKANEIFSKSTRLDQAGFTHANVNFPLNYTPGHQLESFDHRFSISAEFLHAENLNGTDMTAFTALRSDFIEYQFTSGSDYIAWAAARGSRLNDIYSNGTNGEFELIRQVTLANNTQSAMDLIVDNRT